MAEVKASDICVWNGYSWVSVKSGKVGFYNGSGFVFDCGKIRVCGGNGNFYYAENDYILVNESSNFYNINILGGGCTEHVNVKANDYWTASTPNFWIKLPTTSGNPGSSFLSIAFLKNLGVPREGQITLTCGSAQIDIYVYQEGL